MQLWDSKFDTYRTWERCKRRELYRENWIEWKEFGKARRIEAFRFLESEFRSSTLTLAAPGGLDWWADDDKALEHAPNFSSGDFLPNSTLCSRPARDSAYSAFPEYAAQPTWLARCLN